MPPNLVDREEGATPEETVPKDKNAEQFGQSQNAAVSSLPSQDASLQVKDAEISAAVMKSSVALLSPEVFERIFAYRIFDDKDHQFSQDYSHATLALVCRFWKDVLYGSKRLWSRIEMTCTHRSRRHIQMSEGVTRQVVWDYRLAYDMWRTRRHVVEDITEIASSIDSLTLVHHPTEVDMAIRSDFPVLFELDIYVVQDPYTLFGEWDTLLLPVNLTALRCLSLG